MLNIAGIFKNKVINASRLAAFGFTISGEEHVISYNILNDQFQLNIVITGEGAVSVQVMDTDSQEEYVLIHTPDAAGAFVCSVIKACDEKLIIIAEKCFDVQVFQSEQAKQTIQYAEQTHQDRLEFLWEKFSGNAVLRRSDNRKWYAVMLTVSKTKLGLGENESVEIIDLRGLPEEIEQLIDGKNYFPGYHMNKKHWYTICLDGSVSTQEICERIEKSYLLAKKS